MSNHINGILNGLRGMITRLGPEDGYGAMYQTLLPYHLNKKASAAAIGTIGALKLGSTVKNNVRGFQTGPNTGMRKLSSMTDSVLHSDPDANLAITPHLKSMNDKSSKEAILRGKEIESRFLNRPEKQINEDVGGELVFALHNLR